MFGITNKIKLISSLIFFKINQQEEQARENEAQFCRNNKEKLETWINQSHDKQLEIDPGVSKNDSAQEEARGTEI